MLEVGDGNGFEAVFDVCNCPEAEFFVTDAIEWFLRRTRQKFTWWRFRSVKLELHPDDHL